MRGWKICEALAAAIVVLLLPNAAMAQCTAANGKTGPCPNGLTPGAHNESFIPGGVPQTGTLQYSPPGIGIIESATVNPAEIIYLPVPLIESPNDLFNGMFGYIGGGLPGGAGGGTSPATASPMTSRQQIGLTGGSPTTIPQPPPPGGPPLTVARQELMAVVFLGQPGAPPSTAEQEAHPVEEIVTPALDIANHGSELGWGGPTYLEVQAVGAGVTAAILAGIAMSRGDGGGASNAATEAINAANAATNAAAGNAGGAPSPGGATGAPSNAGTAGGQSTQTSANNPPAPQPPPPPLTEEQLDDLSGWFLGAPTEKQIEEENARRLTEQWEAERARLAAASRGVAAQQSGGAPPAGPGGGPAPTPPSAGGTPSAAGGATAPSTNGGGASSPGNAGGGGSMTVAPETFNPGAFPPELNGTDGQVAASEQVM